MEKILIADDIPSNRLLLRRMLELRGYAVIQAVDGQEAVELYHHERPDLVLMDINMPRLDGRQATAAIKQAAGEDHVPIIFVTAMKERTSLVDALAAGGDDFVGKPVDMEVLYSKISAHLRIRELNRQLRESNTRLRKHNRHLAREQELAEYFFENALAESFLDPAYIRYHIVPMSAFCGDLLLAEKGPNGGLYVLVGDFTGHGLSAAMGTLPVAQVFFRMARKGMYIGDIVREINRHLVTLMPVDMFFAATLIEISPTGERLSVWAGGMPDAFMIGARGERQALIGSAHMPLGIVEDAQFDATVQMYSPAPGSRLYICSDGTIESTGRGGEAFGSERLLSLLETPAEGRMDRVIAGLDTFIGGCAQHDDMTLVELACEALLQKTETPGTQLSSPAAIMPLSMSLTLSAAQIRELDPVEPLVCMLEAQAGIKRHRGFIHTILSELYTNALEHGLLCLDSCAKSGPEQFEAYYAERERALNALHNGSIRIDIVIDRCAEMSTLTIRVSDSGEGYRECPPKECGDELHGRGMQILAGLCQALTVSDGGRTVEAVYAID